MLHDGAYANIGRSSLSPGFLYFMAALFFAMWIAGIVAGLYLLRLSADVKANGEALELWIYGRRVGAMRWRDVDRIVRETGGSHGVTGRS